LELTEGILLQDAETTSELLHGLKDLGIRMALDHFGAGRLSLGHLRRFPISMLKIDPTFVGDLSGQGHGRAVVGAIIALGKSLGQRVSAEGIETEDQLNALRALNCDEGQGFHFTRPLPADDFAAFATRLRAGLTSDGSNSGAPPAYQIASPPRLQEAV